MCADAAQPEKRTAQGTLSGAHLFSMTDEEQDLAAFQEYLHSLSAEALWDVRQHIDADRYPRRTEAALHEVERRRLFYLNPYTPLERKLRLLFGCLVLLSALAAALHAVGTIPIPLLPGEKLSYFYDLAAGGPKAARMVLPLTRFLASLCFAAGTAGVLVAGVQMARLRLRAEVLMTGVGALGISAVLLLASYL